MFAQSSSVWSPSLSQSSYPDPGGIISMRGVASVGDMFLVTAGTEMCQKEKAKY